MAYTDIKRQIDSLRGKIAAHGKLTDEQKRKINYKFRLEWNYNSNSMEGNTLTVAETRSVMIGNLDVHQKPIKDVIEMQGHDQIITEILNVGKGDARLSERRVKEIHKAIIHESEEIRKEQIGEWKTANNEIINHKGEKYTFVDWKEVPDRMHDLLNTTNAAIDAIHANKKDAPHPIDIALDFHLEFLNIHPFHDGNGRTSRILTNLILISLGYTPFWINKPERGVYYNYISDIQGYGGKTDLLNEYIATLILRSEKLVMDVIEGKEIEEDDDLYKEISIWKKQLGQHGEVLSRNNELVANVYFNSIKPFLSEFLNKLEYFDELFDKKFVYNHVESQPKKVFALEGFDDIFEQILEQHDVKASVLRYDSQLIDQVRNLKLYISYNGFKNADANTFGKYIDINVRFEEYNYSVSNSETLVTKLYSELITEDEVKTLVKSLIAEIFDSIKKYTIKKD